MRILDQQRATMVTRNVDVQRIRVEDEALQRQQLLERQRNELMNPTTGYITNAMTFSLGADGINTLSDIPTRRSYQFVPDQSFGVSTCGIQRRNSYILFLLHVDFQFLFS